MSIPKEPLLALISLPLYIYWQCNCECFLSSVHYDELQSLSALPLYLKWEKLYIWPEKIHLFGIHIRI